MPSATFEHPKDPDETLDYAYDFAALLASGESVASHVVTVSGVTLDSDSEASGVVTAWLSGGTDGADATVTYQITTDNTPARIFERTVTLRIRSR